MWVSIKMSLMEKCWCIRNVFEKKKHVRHRFEKRMWLYKRCPRVINELKQKYDIKKTNTLEIKMVWRKKICSHSRCGHVSMCGRERGRCPGQEKTSRYLGKAKMLRKRKTCQGEGNMSR